MGNVQTANFMVAIGSLSEHPVVAADGSLTHEVTFCVRPAEDQPAFEVDGGVVRGEVLSRCLALRDKGAVKVTMPSHREPSQNKDHWHKEIVNAALDQAKNESA